MAAPSDRASTDTAAPRPAASVVLIRDGGGGLEVLMMERHRAAAVAFAGALVFPGGKVDAEDRAEAARDAAAGPGAPDPAFRLAAVRETFEEAGILLARALPLRAGSAGSMPDGATAMVDAAAARRLVATARSGAGADGDGRQERGGRGMSGAGGAGGEKAGARGAGQGGAGQGGAGGFGEMLRAAGLSPAVDDLVHFGHWITPLWAPRRFDTHFFLAAAPQDQRIDADAREAAALAWMQPAEVLARADAGRCTLVDVTRFTLELLQLWPSVGEAMRVARGRPVVTVLPVRERMPDGRMLLRIPPEAGYPRSEMVVEAR